MRPILSSGNQILASYHAAIISYHLLRRLKSRQEELSYQITGRWSGRRLSGLDNSKVCEPGILPSPCPDVILLGKMSGYDGLVVGQKKSPAFSAGLAFLGKAVNALTYGNTAVFSHIFIRRVDRLNKVHKAYPCQKHFFAHKLSFFGKDRA